MKQAIIIVGGYNSLWSAYLRLARHLEDMTGLQAVGVPLMPWHWWQAERSRDATRVLQKLQETVVWARRKFQAEEFILVGHSAGGVIARLYQYDRPVWGQTYAGVEHTTAIITLGSPHCSHKGLETSWFLTKEANRLVPGTPYAAHVRYHAVAGQYVRGRQDGTYSEYRAFRMYGFFHDRADGWGDGVVPVGCAGLDGADSLVLQGVAHSRKVDAGWYGGSKAIIRRWWPDGVGRAR